MRLSKKKRTKKFRLQIIPEIEDLISKKRNNQTIKQKVGSFDDRQFWQAATDVLHYEITRTILQAIGSALEIRARKYLTALKEDIRRLSRGAYAVDEVLLERLIDKNGETIVDVVRRIWTTPNVLWFNNYKYRESFNLIAEYCGLDSKSTARLRQRITADFYEATDDVKNLFELRFPKSEFQEKFWEFMQREIFSDRDLSNFLRYGKTLKSEMDPRNFEKTKARFKKRHKLKRQ